MKWDDEYRLTQWVEYCGLDAVGYTHKARTNLTKEPTNLFYHKIDLEIKMKIQMAISDSWELPIFSDKNNNKISKAFDPCYYRS